MHRKNSLFILWKEGILLAYFFFVVPVAGAAPPFFFGAFFGFLSPIEPTSFCLILVKY